MKKRLFMFAVLLLSGLQFAVAAIDEQLRALITTSDDIEVTEVTNDEAYPWKVENGMASSTNGKQQYTTSTITIKFKTIGRTTLNFDYTLDGYSNYDSLKVAVDGKLWWASYESKKVLSPRIEFMDIKEGEHVLTFSHRHGYYTYSSATEVISLGNIRIRSLESQYMTINLAAPGTLGVEVLSHVSTLPEMRYLRLTGKMNNDDWTTISNMTGLYAIDMSEADITDIPDNGFEKTALRFVTLPKVLKTIGNKAFYERYLLGTLTLPEGLESIGNYAFYRNLISEVTIPASVNFMGYDAFEGNGNLTSVTLGSGLTSLSSSCFQSCGNLVTVYGGENIKSIYSNAFYDCSKLKSIGNIKVITVGQNAFRGCRKLENIDFSRIKTIEYGAFWDCYYLTEANLTTLETMGSYAFYNSSLRKVIIGDKVTTISDYAFQECGSLEEVILGSSINKIGSRCFYSSSSSLKRFYINAPAPPSINSNYLPFYSTTSVTLYVPEYAMVSYKLDNYWSKFTTVEPNPNMPEKVNLYKKLELTSNARIPNSPDMFIGKGGSLIVNGNNPQAFGKFSQHLSIGEPEVSSSLISRCEAITSAASQFDFFIGSTSGYGYWYYICMPYDVKRSDIILPEGTSIAVRYYDAESRATNGPSGNWKDVAADGILRKGQGYIFRTDKEGNVGFPATEETHNDIFCSTAITTPLKEYAAVESANAGWNLVGNPYPCFYDIYHMDFTAPITTWNVDNRTFNAYSVADDELVLTPLQAFFVQKPALVDAITFQASGRQIDKTIDHSGLAKRFTAGCTRKLVDLALTSGERTDHTRLVVNANASDDFSADNDAIKMMAYEGTPQLYTLGGDNQFAINEGAHRSGNVAVGMYLPADATYVISVERDDVNVKLLDYGVAVDMPYTFNATEGSLDDRFSLAFDANTTGINNVENNAKTNDAIYTIDGRRVSNTAKKGIYIQNNKKIVK